MLLTHLFGDNPRILRGLALVHVDVPPADVRGPKGRDRLGENDVEPPIFVQVRKADTLSGGVERRLVLFSRFDESAVGLLEKDFQTPFLAVGEDDVVESITV